MIGQKKLVMIDISDDLLLIEIIKPYIEKEFPEFGTLQIPRSFLVKECIRLAVETIRRK